MNCRENIDTFVLIPFRGWREGGADGREGDRKGDGGRQGRRGPSEAG